MDGLTWNRDAGWKWTVELPPHCHSAVSVLPWAEFQAGQLAIHFVWREKGHEAKTGKDSSMSSGFLPFYAVTADSLEKILMLGRTEGKRRRGQQRMRWLDGITRAAEMNMGKLWEIVSDREDWCTAVRRVAKSWTWLSGWTTPNEQWRYAC